MTILRPLLKPGFAPFGGKFDGLAAHFGDWQTAVAPQLGKN
jgi:hypothetical protein